MKEIFDKIRLWGSKSGFCGINFRIKKEIYNIYLYRGFLVIKLYFRWFCFFYLR